MHQSRKGGENSSSWKWWEKNPFAGMITSACCASFYLSDFLLWPCVWEPSWKVQIDSARWQWVTTAHSPSFSKFCQHVARFAIAIRNTGTPLTVFRPFHRRSSQESFQWPWLRGTDPTGSTVQVCLARGSVLLPARVDAGWILGIRVLPPENNVIVDRRETVQSHNFMVSGLYLQLELHHSLFCLHDRVRYLIVIRCWMIFSVSATNLTAIFRERKCSAVLRLCLPWTISASTSLPMTGSYLLQLCSTLLRRGRSRQFRNVCHVEKTKQKHICTGTPEVGVEAGSHDPWALQWKTTGTGMMSLSKILNSCPFSVSDWTAGWQTIMFAETLRIQHTSRVSTQTGCGWYFCHFVCVPEQADDPIYSAPQDPKHCKWNSFVILETDLHVFVAGCWPNWCSSKNKWTQHLGSCSTRTVWRNGSKSTWSRKFQNFVKCWQRQNHSCSFMQQRVNHNPDARQNNTRCVSFWLKLVAVSSRGRPRVGEQTHTQDFQGGGGCKRRAEPMI